MDSVREIRRVAYSIRNTYRHHARNGGPFWFGDSDESLYTANRVFARSLQWTQWGSDSRYGSAWGACAEGLSLYANHLWFVATALDYNAYFYGLRTYANRTIESLGVTNLLLTVLEAHDLSNYAMVSGPAFVTTNVQLKYWCGTLHGIYEPVFEYSRARNLAGDYGQDLLLISDLQLKARRLGVKGKAIQNLLLGEQE